jgi:hypothetical protein
MNEPAVPCETWCVTQLGDLFTILDSQRVPVNAA